MPDNRNITTFQYVIIVKKSRTMTWVGHIERMGEMSDKYEILAGNPKWKTRGLRTDTVTLHPQEHKVVLGYFPKIRCILLRIPNL